MHFPSCKLFRATSSRMINFIKRASRCSKTLFGFSHAEKHARLWCRCLFRGMWSPACFRPFFRYFSAYGKLDDAREQETRSGIFPGFFFFFFFVTTIYAFQYFCLEQRCFLCIALESDASRIYVYSSCRTWTCILRVPLHGSRAENYKITKF